MQSALAVIQFPMVAVPSTAPDPAPITQDFAIAFAADLPAFEGDISPADTTTIAVDQSFGWFPAAIALPGSVPVGLQGLAVADDAQGDPAFAVDATRTLNEGDLPKQAPAVGPFIPQVVVDGRSNAIDSPSDQTREVPVPGHKAKDAPAKGKLAAEIAPFPEPRSPAKNLDVRPTEEGQADQVAETVHERGIVEPVPKPAIGQVAAIVPAGQVLSAIKSGDSAGPGPLQNAPLLPPQPDKRLVAAPLATTDAAAVPPPTEIATDEAAPLRTAEAETGLPQASDAVKVSGLAAVEARAAPASAAVPAAAVGLSAPETVAPGSFWERYFSDRSDPQPEPVSLPGQVAHSMTESGQGASGIAPQLALPRDEALADPSPDDMSFAADKGRADRVTVRAAAPSEGAGPPAAPETRPEPGPVVQVLPWTEGVPDRFERFEPSLPFLSAASASGQTNGPGGPVSLPVQQVAVQLAGVLVQASDRATELALAPEELGKVRLRLEPDAANPDRLTILINVERPETLDLFRRHAGELAEAIRAAGYSGADIDFGRHGRGDSHSGPQSGPPAGTDLTSDEIATIPPSPRAIAGATLDLRL